MSDTMKAGAPARPTGAPGFGRRGPGMGGPGMGGPMMLPGAKAKNLKGTMRRLAASFGGQKGIIIAAWGIAAASTVFAIVGPKLLGRATTTLFEGAMAAMTGSGGIDTAAISRILLFALGLYVTSALLSYLQGWIMSGIAVDTAYRFRREIAEKMNRMPLRYFDGTNHGDTLSRITNDVDLLAQSLSQSLSQLITSLATVVGVLVMMLSISWRLTLVAFVVMPLSLVFVTAVVKKSQKLFTAQQRHLAEVNSHVEEMYGGHVVMKVFGGENRSAAAFRERNDLLYKAAWKAQFLSGLMMPMMGFIGNLGYVAIAVLGGYYATKRTLAVGDIQAFMQYMRNFTQPMSQIANISNVLQQTAAAAERVFEFLDEDEETQETAEAADATLVRGHVEFDHVRFGYSPDKIIIKDLSAYADRGHKIAIVGPTGAGKTTMVKLLMRFYDLDAGRILVDGIDARQFRRKDLRKCFGMVLQDTWLFSGTIMENIRYGRPEASDEEVVAAAKTAHADHFIRAQPEGYATLINEEANNLSQGQKQLLTIARAVIADPKMLILDEATSSVDTRTELLIQKAMDNLMANRTSFIIAHRLSTIKNADLILVMKDGDIVEQGRHEELLAKCGFYAEIYASQFDASGAVETACAS